MKVLLVDDDAELRDLYARALLASNLEVVAANTAQAALDALEEAAPDLVVLDIMLPMHNGITVMYEMQSYDDWAKIPVVILSGVPKDDIFPDAASMQRLNVVEYCYKPSVPPNSLAKFVRRILAK